MSIKCDYKERECKAKATNNLMNVVIVLSFSDILGNGGQAVNKVICFLSYCAVVIPSG